MSKYIMQYQKCAMLLKYICCIDTTDTGLSSLSKTKSKTYTLIFNINEQFVCKTSYLKLHFEILMFHLLKKINNMILNLKKIVLVIIKIVSFIPAIKIPGIKLLHVNRTQTLHIYS